jgi:pyrroloquinoline quinone (PQQ) biosynthesis protein C
MNILSQIYGVRDVYDFRTGDDGRISLDLRDQTIELDERSHGVYVQIAQMLRGGIKLEVVAATLGVSVVAVERYLRAFQAANLVYERERIPEQLSGPSFHDEYFAKVLGSWLYDGFSHPFWERMLSGRGSARLYAGWLFELYHYTKNANRHMPLACSHARIKQIKKLRAKHYAEEWNHFHYFTKALSAMGFSKQSVEASEPLPMTLEMSNFMRQAAREDVLAYSICSAVLEGTTVGQEHFDGFYERSMAHYGVPHAAVKPIYDHLDLDKQYEHSNLFREILAEAGTISAERASRVLEYGRQLSEHIWMWTEQIERYYEKTDNPVPRMGFDYSRQ